MAFEQGVYSVCLYPSNLHCFEIITNLSSKHVEHILSIFTHLCHHLGP